MTYTERLSKYIIIGLAILAAGIICWYFSSVLAYVLIAAVLSLIASPVAEMLCKVHFHRFHIPKWICTILSILIVLAVILGIFSFMIPIIAGVILDFDISNLKMGTTNSAAPLMELNRWLTDTFPSLGEGFRVETALLENIGKWLDVSTFTSVFGGVTSIATDLAIGIFSVVFISFFFIYDDTLFSRMILSLVKPQYEERTCSALKEVNGLLSRYFIGISIEVVGVALINTLGLYFIAGFSFAMSAGIAFITGLLNIIPYVGPLTGGVIGTFLGIIIRFYSLHPMGIDVSFPAFAGILIGIFTFTQLIDNFIYQPLIYSSSIKAHPLEIFIVLLMAGHIGGIIGMLAAIPSYTVIRVFAAKFLSHIKAVRLLTEPKTDSKHD